MVVGSINWQCGAVDFTLAMPFLLVALVVVVVFGQSLELIIVLLILFGWDNFARVVRAETLTLRESDYVSYARIQGASQSRILFRHILPGVVGSVLVIGSLRVGSLILTESTLSFLGVGVPPRHPRMGHHGVRRSSAPLPRLVDQYDARHRHLPSRDGLQLPRRLAPRLVRSAVTAVAGAVIEEDPKPRMSVPFRLPPFGQDSVEPQPRQVVIFRQTFKSL